MAGRSTWQKTGSRGSKKCLSMIFVNMRMSEARKPIAAWRVGMSVQMAESKCDKRNYVMKEPVMRGWPLAFTTSLLLLSPGPPARGQYLPSGLGAVLFENPSQRAALQQRALVLLGPGARAFLATQGDEGLLALWGCSRPSAIRLLQFHACGGLDRLPRPRAFLYVVGTLGQGDVLVEWALAHYRELTDEEQFDAFMSSPLEYAWGVRRLESTNRAWSPGSDWRGMVFWGALLAAAGLIVWRKRAQKATWVMGA